MPNSTKNIVCRKQDGQNNKKIEEIYWDVIRWNNSRINVILVAAMHIAKGAAPSCPNFLKANPQPDLRILAKIVSKRHFFHIYRL